MFNNINFLLRIITAILGSFLLAVSILNPWTYFVIFLAILLSCLIEFYFILEKNNYRPFAPLGLLFGTFLFVISFSISAQIIPSIYYNSLLIIFPFICILILYYKNLSDALINLSLSFSGIIYIALPFSLLNLIAFDSGVYDYTFIAGILLYTWVSESASYIGGTIFGKTKLSSISPNKTWEGVLFGLVSNVILSFVLSHYFVKYSLLFCLFFGLIVLTVGIFGDLFESLVKRGFNLKDSSNKLPGHGGYLDRFDSLLFIIPNIYFYLLFVKHLT